ncbi:outer membrane protein, OMP85 family [Trichuris trichiura]|uniref:Outer membrane protein, OMP85 family n=1 Tax=Trichuris trichiura TaxID=36087 RepID=A0A077Z8P2_TRITR|nr:outer membrane protein, OMP85 family [Trichuris trichiura]
MLSNVFGPYKDKLYESEVAVERIHYDGVRRTKPGALEAVSRQLFSSKTLGELVLRSYLLKNYMEEVGLFRKVDVSIEPDPLNYYGVDVVFSIDEPTRLKAMANAGVCQNGLTTGVELSSLSVTGRGDSMKASLCVGRERTSLFDFQYLKPLLHQPGSSLGANIFRHFKPLPQCDGISLESGVSLDLRHQLTPTVAYGAHFTNCWRFFDSRSLLFLIREHAGHSVKVSFEHSLEYSSEDDRILPTTGVFGKISQEFARFWGDVLFTKYHLDLKRHFRLPFGFFTSYVCSLVHVAPEPGRALSFIDKTYLGGTQNLRGFGLNSVGSSAGNGLYLGGTGSCVLAAHLFRPLLENFLYAHGFLCVGSLWQSPYSNPFRKAWEELRNGPRRSSIGLGVVIKLGNTARIEANYCWPLEYRVSDKAEKGFQVGFGTCFL